MKEHKGIEILKNHIEDFNVLSHRTQAIGNCPFCGKEEKFYVNKFNLKWDCKSCGEYGQKEKIIKLLNLESEFEDLNLNILSLKKVETISLEKEEIESKNENKFLKDFLWQFEIIDLGDAYYDYLISRGYKHNFIVLNRNRFYKSISDKKLSEYIIMPIRQKGEIVGYVGRLMWSGEKFAKYNEGIFKRFLGNQDLLKRFEKKKYKNSTETKFSELLYGIEDIKKGKTLIIVEGIFDKLSVDLFIDKYELYSQFCCVCTFGKKLSDKQIKEIISKQVGEVILFWDRDAIPYIRKDISKFNKFKNFHLCFTDEDGKDAGDSQPKEIKKFIERKVSARQLLNEIVEIKDI